MSDNQCERKYITISSKRQLTIPQKFFTKLGFGTEAECILRDNELIIRPVAERVSGELSEQILEELIEKGLSGKELISAFKERHARIREDVQTFREDVHAFREDVHTKISATINEHKSK